MDGKAGLWRHLVGTAVMALGVFFVLAGCQKDRPAAGTPATQTRAKVARPVPMKHEATGGPAQPTAQVAEQTTCPVMGGPIDKNVFIEYQGKKVYFCCPACVDTFKANPEKYISKLPQFAK